MLPNDPNAPWWATEADYPDPGVVDYMRQVGSVVGGYSREELSVYLMQRGSEPIQLSLAGVRLCAVEADLFCEVVRSAMRLMARADAGEAADGLSGSGVVPTSAGVADEPEG
jgi:hypothetical protein